MSKHSRRRVLSERPVSTSVVLEETSIGLESCLSAEEANLLDKRISVEIEFLVISR